MNPDVTQNFSQLIWVGIPLLLLFIGGVFVATWARLKAQSIWKGSNGNQRKADDKNWPVQMLTILGRMDAHIDTLTKTLQDGLSDDITEIRKSLHHNGKLLEDCLNREHPNKNDV